MDLLDPGRGKKVLVIPNGWDTYQRDRFETELRHTTNALRDFGLTATQFDLKAADRESVGEALKDKAMVMVMAGNTFYLNYYLVKSGFSEVIKDELEQGLLYGGESAGAVVAGVTLHGVEKVDDPRESPEIFWDGIGLVDFGVVPHYGWAKYRQPLEQAKSEMEQYAEVRMVTNQQALVFVDGKIEIVENPSSEAE
jgi:dipeptidase E